MNVPKFKLVELVRVEDAASPIGYRVVQTTVATADTLAGMKLAVEDALEDEFERQVIAEVTAKLDAAKARFPGAAAFRLVPPDFGTSDLAADQIADDWRDVVPPYTVGLSPT